MFLEQIQHPRYIREAGKNIETCLGLEVALGNSKHVGDGVGVRAKLWMNQDGVGLLMYPTVEQLDTIFPER